MDIKTTILFTIVINNCEAQKLFHATVQSFSAQSILREEIKETKRINENLSVTYMCAKELMLDSLDIGVEFVYLIDVPSTST